MAAAVAPLNKPARPLAVSPSNGPGKKMRTGASPRAAAAASSGGARRAGFARARRLSAKSSLARSGPTRAGARVELDASDPSSERHELEALVLRGGPLEAHDARQGTSRVIDRPRGHPGRSVGEGPLELLGVEHAATKRECRGMVGGDHDVFELTRINAAMTRRKRAKLHVGDDHRDERHELRVRQNLARPHLHVTV